MLNTIYIICIQNPFRKFPLTLCKQESKVFLCKKLEIFNQDVKIVAYDFESLVGIFRENKWLELPWIFDVRTALKLAAGKPKSEFKSNNEPWQLKKTIGKYLSKDAMHWLSSFLDLNNIDFKDYDNENPFAIQIMEGFEKAWADICIDLASKAEYDRYINVECEVYNIFLKTQLKGICVSQEKLKCKLSSLKTSYYRAIKNLELEYGFQSQQINNDLTWKDIEDFSNLCKSADEIDSDFWRFIEIYGEYDVFLKNLATARNSGIDYNALLRYNLDQYDRIYPRFDIVGTVTSRILVESPGFQYLKKTSRSIIVPSKDYSLLYADFAQFEPGIVAHHSKDKNLIELYNKGDIYSELSVALFGDISNRKLSKIIFLSFLYGMSQKNIGRLIEKVSSSEAQANAFSFFDKFDTLCLWKDKVCEAGKKNGFAETSFGNKRYTKNSDSLSAKELRWIPNQIVQGTASLIFKRSLIELSKKRGCIHFLLPMHDAILVEVPIKNEFEEKKYIEEVFIRNFEAECPEINAKVTFERFDN